MNVDPDKRLLSSILDGSDPLAPALSDSILEEQADLLTDDEVSALDDASELVREIRVAVGAAEFADEPALKRALEAIAPEERAPEGQGSDEQAATDSVARENSSSATTLRAGERLGGYEIIELLGAGGMGTVYRARQVALDRDVAVKLIHASLFADARARLRFSQEAVAMGAVNHPNLVLALDTGDSPQGPFLVMEYVVGQSLAQYVRRNGPAPWRQACEWVRQATLGLRHAHAQALVHRDIKPANLMLSIDGTVLVLDLGLARLRSTEATAHTRTGAMLGTIDYMAPEQATDAARVDARADLYSLGCTLFELVTGHPPFSSFEMPSVAQRLLAHVRTPAPKLSASAPDVPGELDALVAKLLQKDPRDRFSTADDLLRALEQLLASDGRETMSAKSSVSALSSSLQASTGKSKRGLAIATTLLVAATLVGACVLALTSPPFRDVAESPAPIAAAGSSSNAPVQPPPPAVVMHDVLPLDELAACAVRGEWRRVEDSLVSSADANVSFLQVPYAPRGEYDVLAEVTPLDENAMIMIGMSAGEHPFHALFAPTITALENVDGVDVRESRAARASQGHGMSLGDRSRIECRVRRDRIIVVVDGAELIDWRGDQSRLSLNPFYASLYGDALFLASQYRVRFHSLQVREFGEHGKRLSPPLVRKAADRRLAIAHLGESLADVLTLLESQNSEGLLRLERDNYLAPDAPYLLRARFVSTPCDVATLESLAQLEVPLSVDFLNCPDLPPELLHQALAAPRLVQLDLHETGGLNESHLTSPNISTVLRFLGAGKATFSGASSDAFRSFGALRTVWAHQSQLSASTLSQLAKCAQLEVIGLPAGTTDASLELFAKHPKIRHLEVLGASGVTDASVPIFNSLPSLGYLKLYHTSISGDGQAALTQSPSRRLDLIPRAP